MSEQVKFSNFAGYKQTVFEITDDLKKLRDFSQKLKLDGNTAAIEDVLKRLTDDTFSIAIVGEFKRGKSTLINALLGKDVLPTNVLPTTATLNKITYSVTPFVRIDYKDGKSEEIEIEKLNDYVTKLTRESEERAKTVKEATVFYPVNYCKNGVTIIDTPGLNDDEAMTEVTMSVLPQIDAALMVIMAQSPFSDSERDFLESKIIASDLGRVLFVVTGIDLIMDDDDKEKALKGITSRIQEHVITKVKNTYGEGSKEFEAYKRKIGNVKVYGLSAKQALKAKVKGDDAMLAESRFPAFEAALERFLSEERGAIMLNVPVNRIITSSVEIMDTIRVRESALLMEKDQFQEKYKQAMEEIQAVRIERQAEFEQINKSAQRAYDDLMPAIANFWPTLESAAMNAIEYFNLTDADLAPNAIKTTNENLHDAVKNAIGKEIQSMTERIQTTIDMALASEAERISGFEENFFKATEKIQGLFFGGDTSIAKANNDDTVSTIMNVALRSTPLGLALGTAYMGFKRAGFKGALLGGASGFVGAFGSIALLAPLAITGWPMVLVAALVSSITGKFALNKFFPDNKLEKYKTSFKASVTKELEKKKSESDIEERVRSQIDTAFEALKARIKAETEHILTDMEKQNAQLNEDALRANMTGEKAKEELVQMVTAVNEICLRADANSKQLTAILSKQGV